MTRPSRVHISSELDFVVVECPVDPILNEPLLWAGETFHRSEVAPAVVNGFVPEGAKLSTGGEVYVACEQALYKLDADGAQNEKPSFVPYTHSTGDIRWRIHKNTAQR